MRDHAEPGDMVRWPAGSEWAWRVAFVFVADGTRYLSITRGDLPGPIVTRVVREDEVSSNQFELHRAASATAEGSGG